MKSLLNLSPGPVNSRWFFLVNFSPGPNSWWIRPVNFSPGPVNFQWISGEFSVNFSAVLKQSKTVPWKKIIENSLAPGKNSREKFTRLIHLKFTCPGEEFTGKNHWPWEKNSENSPATHKKVECDDSENSQQIHSGSCESGETASEKQRVNKKTAFSNNFKWHLC